MNTKAVSDIKYMTAPIIVKYSTCHQEFNSLLAIEGDWNFKVVRSVAERSPHSYIFSEMAYLTSNQYMA
jgi:hypothetical protein